MLPRTLFIAGFLLLSFNVFAQTVTDEECNRYHTGDFIDGSLPYVTIHRDSTYQVETDTRTGKSSTYLVTWIDACTYTLTMVKTDDRKERKADKAIGVLRVTITYVDDDGYRYICTAPGLETPFRGSIKVKK